LTPETWEREARLAQEAAQEEKKQEERFSQEGAAVFKDPPAQHAVPCHGVTQGTRDAGGENIQQEAEESISVVQGLEMPPSGERDGEKRMKGSRVLSSERTRDHTFEEPPNGAARASRIPAIALKGPRRGETPRGFSPPSKERPRGAVREKERPGVARGSTTATSTRGGCAASSQGAPQAKEKHAAASREASRGSSPQSDNRNNATGASPHRVVRAGFRGVNQEEENYVAASREAPRGFSPRPDRRSNVASASPRRPPKATHSPRPSRPSPVPSKAITSSPKLGGLSLRNPSGRRSAPAAPQGPPGVPAVDHILAPLRG